jgi:hypothetical protein
MQPSDSIQGDHELAMAAMAPAAAQYLSVKPALLNAPGTKLHDVYYSSVNSTVEAAEVTYNMGRLVLTLNSLSFSSSNQVVIPNSSLVGGIFLHLAMDLGSAASVTVPRGWGYAAIQSINYQLGSSNANQQQLSGQSLWQVLAEQITTAEKASEFYRLGGQEYLTPQGVIEADLFIPLPWSTACGSAQKLPFDTAMLNSPIYITISFNPASAFIGGSGVKPSQFTDARLLVRQGDFSNKDLSLGPLIKRDPRLIYGYPFVHHQTFQSTILAGTAGIPMSFNLLSILNADLIGISYGVVMVSDYAPTGGNTPNPFNYQDVRDVQLLYNGQVMWNTPGTLDKLMSAYMIDGAGYFFNSIVAAGATAPYASAPKDTYVRHIDFSRRREACFGQEFANVWRIGNNSLSMQFTPVTTGNCIVFITYHYNGLADIQNGESRLLY